MRVLRSASGSKGGKREKGKVGKLSAYAVFSNSFILKYSIYQGAMLWGNMS